MSNNTSKTNRKTQQIGLASTLGPAPTLDPKTTEEADKVLRLRNLRRSEKPVVAERKPSVRRNVQHINTGGANEADNLSFPATTSAAIDILDTSLSRYKNLKR